MTITEYNALQATLPEPEAKHLRVYFMKYAEVLTWPQYINNGYSHINPVAEDKVKVNEKPSVALPSKGSKYLLYPTKLARTTPFYIMSPNEKNLCLEYKRVVIETRWGYMEWSGPKLSIDDGDVLFAILKMSQGREGIGEIHTTCNEICKQMGRVRSPQLYKSISNSLRRLGRTAIELATVDKNKTPINFITGPLFVRAEVDLPTKKIYVKLNDCFEEAYKQHAASYLDYEMRKKLRGGVAKGLQTFLSSHRRSSEESRPIAYGVETLAEAIGLDISGKEKKEIRRQINYGLKQLHKQGFIGKGEYRGGSYICKDNNVHIP